MTTKKSGGRRGPQKYPDELRERAVRMVQEIRRETGESHGVVARVARELGVGAQSLSGWVNRAEIDAHRTNVSGGLRWGVEPICEVLLAAPTTYRSAKTRPPCARQVRDAELGPQLKALWKRNYSVYGRRKLAKAARRAGHDVGRDQVARLMRAEGIRGASRAKRRFTTHADPAALRAPDLVKRDLTATRPDELWL